MVNSYSLVNPYIDGSFTTTVKAKNSIEAGKHFYTSLSEHFNNELPDFYFSIQKGLSGGGKHYHFQAKETKHKKEVSFSLEPFNGVSESNITNFNKKLETFKNKMVQSGGKNKDKKKHKKSSKKSKKKKDSDSESSDSSDSDSDDYYKTRRSYTPVINQPFYYWWYDPYVYNLNSLYIPTFYSYVGSPYIEISIG